MLKPDIVFVCGAYRAYTSTKQNANVLAAARCAEALWRSGYPTICPHINTQQFDESDERMRKTYLEGYKKILSQCSLLVVLPSYLSSSGALEEIKYARTLGMKIKAYLGVDPETGEALLADFESVRYVPEHFTTEV